MKSFDSPKFIEEKIILSLKMTRKGKGLTQYDLAKRMNVSRDTIARLESGRARATLVHVINIARFLDVSLSNLLLDEEIKYRLDSSPNVENSTSQTMPHFNVKWSNKKYYSQSQPSEPSEPSEPKINPFLSMGAVEHYGAKMEQYIIKHKSLWWGVGEKDLIQLSISAVVEAILNYGKDEDLATLFEIVSLETVSDIFKAANQGNRTNYKAETIRFYNQYFKKHVPGYTL